MLRQIEIKNIKANGWAKRYLETMLAGLTGNMDKVGSPFVRAYWEGDKNLTVGADENFLGGLNVEEDAWTPFEQNGYWIDGLTRTAFLADDKAYIEKAKAKIYPCIENADTDGYLGPAFLKDGMTWAHAVYFRSLCALYEATGDGKILDALTKHFLRRPLKEVHDRKGSARIIDVRDVADIETALWLYGKTGDGRLLTAAENSYARFNEKYADDRGVKPFAKTRDLTVKGMLSNKKVDSNHGVTYCELCKLTAVLHLYTGNETYLKAAVNAFDKVVRDQMLIDGCISSTEYLNGNGDSQCAHETCDISDFTWAVGYLFMATGDPKYGDWVENAVFNAGFGAVDDAFKGEQYFSCPNQVLSDDTSNHMYFFRGDDWMSYAPKKFLSCCAGNVHRFFPNFVLRSLMTDGDTLAAFTYAPLTATVELDGKRVTVEEQTQYPFENTVTFTVRTASPAKFTLRLRKPDWAQSATVTVNGARLDAKFAGNIENVARTFSDGDAVTVTFTDKVEFIENAKGVSVKKGALLYALPIDERVEILGLRDCGNPDFPHYALYPQSKWNYGLKRSDEQAAEVHIGKAGQTPWTKSDCGLTLTLPAYEVKDWRLKKVTHGVQRQVARGRNASIPFTHSAVFTPKVTAVKSAQVGDRSLLTLVPYCATRLRIAIFPLIPE